MMGGVSPETCWASYKYKIKMLVTLLHLVGFSLWIILWCTDPRTSRKTELDYVHNLRNIWRPTDCTEHKKYWFHTLRKNSPCYRHVQVLWRNNLTLFLISNFRRVLNIVCFLLGNSPVSKFYMPTFSHINTPTFSNPVILHTYPPMKMEETECSETSAYKIQMPGNYSEESIQQSS
jgi:hypothetical protein